MTTYENDLVVANKIERLTIAGMLAGDIDATLGLPTGTSYMTRQKEGVATYWSTKGLENDKQLVADMKELWDAGYNWVEIDVLLNLSKGTSGFVYMRLGRPWARR